MNEEKTEQPTPHRLRELRSKGQVAKSRDLPSALTVLSVALYFFSVGPAIKERFLALAEMPVSAMNLPFSQALALCTQTMGQLALVITLPLVALVMAVALLAELAQVGPLFALKAAMPKLENLSPSRWFQQVFAMKNAVELIKNILKTLILGWAALSAIKGSLPSLMALPQSSLPAMWAVTAQAALELWLRAAIVFLVLAIADFLFQKWRFTKDNMMSKEEVKRELKDSEGDPHIRQRRKQLRRELMHRSTLSQVRRANVLVVNPTHRAVALLYEKKSTPLPLILAKGKNYLAQRMIAEARRHGVPVLRNVPLARALFLQGTENAFIPRELIIPVAEALRWAAALKHPLHHPRHTP